MTQHTDTGQYSNMSDFGLMYYNARWYDPALGRFTSADTLIPEPGNPQSWDRYAYVRNNPLRYTDPSGHCVSSNGVVIPTQPPYGNSGSCTQNPGEKYLAATVTIRSCDFGGDVYQCSEGLGTKIGDHTVLSHHHYSHKVEEADVVWLEDPVTSETKVQLNYEGRKSAADAMLISTNREIFPGISEIPLANASTIDSIGKGDTLTLVYHGSNGELITGDFDVLKQKNGYIYLENRKDVIHHGDSGGGAFYNGMLVGNITGIVPAQGNMILITINPAWVTNTQWRKFSEEDY